MVLVLTNLSGCGSSDPANGTVKCAVSEPRCPPDFVCVAATDTCWRVGSFDGGPGNGVDAAPSAVDGSLASEAGKAQDGASAIDSASTIDGAPVMDVALDTPKADVALDAPALDVALDSGRDQSVDVQTIDVADAAKDAADASVILDAGTDAYASLSCSELSTEYGTTLAKARVCTVGSTNACGQSALGGIECGCSVPINPAQTTAIAALDALRKAWTAKGCTAVCPAIACILYRSAACSSDGSTTGSCVGVLTPISTL